MLVGELRECYRRSLEKVGGGGEQFFDSHNFNFPTAAILITFSFSFFFHILVEKGLRNGAFCYATDA